jgi:N-acyl-D-amino-acid deacylase
MQGVFNLIESARAAGLRISADMYSYTAGATGLDATMPTWVQEGGHAAWVERLKDPEIRARVALEMRNPDVEWENFFVQAGPEGILLLGFRNPELRSLIGKTLLEVAEERGTDPTETAMNLVIEDDSRVDSAFFLMSEYNVRSKVARPWVSFGSDASAPAAQGVFLQSSVHPRAYGNFARVLGKYVRDEGALSLAEAVRRMTSLPAFNTGIRGRGHLAEGYYADVVVFDPATIGDEATFSEPHQYATGMLHVFVNGEQVLADGEHTGALPGKVVRGPGWSGWPNNADRPK